MATPPPEQDQRYNGIVTAGSDLLNQIHIAVIRLDGKTDNLGSRVSDFRDEVRTKFREIEDRQRAQALEIEKLRDRPHVEPATVWKVIGALLTVMGIVTTIVIAVMKAP